MKISMSLLAGLLTAALLTACGGGGGSAGATTGTTTGGSSSGTGGGTTTSAPTLTLTLENGSGAAITGNSVAPGSTVYAKAVLKDATGAAVANKLVIFNSSSGLVGFQPASGQVLSDSAGVAKVQLIPKSVTSTGAETLSVSATISATNLSASLDIQTTPANVTLTNFAAAQTNLSAFQSTLVTTDVSVNGVAATNTPIQVSFNSNCGAFTPTVATSNSAGKASSTFVASGCAGGTATLSASAVGATAVTTSVNVQAPQATNVLFLSAEPSTIYTSQASFGIKQSIVKFRVIDASGNAISVSTSVQVSLSTSAIAAGVVFADTGTTAPKTLSTDVNGEVTVIVKSGTLPTPLSLEAKLVSNPLISGSSAGLAVNSGQPVQSFFSMAASIYNLEGWTYDNQSSSITVLVADRLGQPVPANTPISFITEGGQVTASCLVTIDGNGKSGCTVSIISQNFRPSNGRVTVLAYTEGEEVFVDANGNNKYDVGETFYDMGQPFLDSNENNTWDASPAEQKVGDSSTPGAGIGTTACATHQFQTANVAGTCDGTWGTTRVRGQIVIVFSTSFASPPTLFNLTSTGVTLTLSDQHGNAMPFGTAVEATIAGGTNCTVGGIIPPSVPNGTNPTSHRIIVTKGALATDTCTGAEVTLKATTPRGNQTLLGSVVIP